MAVRQDHVLRARGGAAYAGFLRRRELGHILGLGHEKRKCAIMNPAFDNSGTPNHCNAHPLSFWLAHPLRGDDIRGAKSLY